jgi:glucose-6-phosphate 1-epimerase
VLNITPFGAHLLSWTVNGRDVLYLSPNALMDGSAPIRGGVPVCFPQFNTRGNLPKHGFARVKNWAEVKGQPCPTYELQANESTLAVWPHPFQTRLVFQEHGDTLTMHWTVKNTGDQSFEFTGALHTYFAVSNIESTYLYGLQGQTCWDALSDKTFKESINAITFAAEFDRVFDAPPHALRIQDGNRNIEVSQSASFADTVVWNPGAIKSAQMPDLGAQGYQHFLCVEAAQVHTPITVEAGDVWAGWQRIKISPELSLAP